MTRSTTFTKHSYDFTKTIQSVLHLMESMGKFVAVSDVEKASHTHLSSYFPNQDTLLNGIFYFFEGLYSAQKQTYFKDPQEFLFEKTMSYFDILAPYKEGYRVLYQEHTLSPGFWLSLLQHISHITQTALCALETPLPPLKNTALHTAYVPLFISMLSVWFDDEHPDLGKTMATLNKRLENIAFLWK